MKQEKMKYKLSAIYSVLKLLLISYKNGELKYVLSLQVKNIAPGEGNGAHLKCFIF